MTLALLVWKLEYSGKVGAIHYNDIIMSTVASQISSLMIVSSSVYSRRRSKKTSKLCVTGLCEGNSPVTGEFLTQRASNAENVSIWWRRHEQLMPLLIVMTWIRILASAQPTTLHNEFKNYSFKITATGPRAQWVELLWLIQCYSPHLQVLVTGGTLIHLVPFWLRSIS